MLSKKENIEFENSSNVEHKLESFDIYGESDVEINTKIEQVNNPPHINENNEQQSEYLVA